MEDKKIWQSKTIIVNAVMAAASLYPPASKWISEHPEGFSCAVAAVNFVLRSVTGESVTWKFWSKKI